MIRAGEPAPDFTLPDENGRAVTLSALWRRGPVVLYFYPRDESAGCTREACAFRDAYEEFRAAGAEVVGVSRDTPASHRSFIRRHRLPFTLVSDADGAIRRLYGVPATLGILDGRATFIIDRAGRVRHAFLSQLFATRHVSEALRVLRKL